MLGLGQILHLAESGPLDKDLLAAVHDWLWVQALLPMAAGWRRVQVYRPGGSDDCVG